MIILYPSLQNSSYKNSSKNEESKSAQNMQENLSDLIRDEKDSPEKDEIKIYEIDAIAVAIFSGYK